MRNTDTRNADARVRPDPDALLAALVLDPATFSRNRFFELFRDTELRRVRRRASILRSVIALFALRGPRVAGVGASRAAGELATEELAGGVTLVRYAVPSIGFRRTVHLDPLEAALVRYAAARATCAAPLERDRLRVEGALGKLFPAPGGVNAAAHE